MKIKLIVAKNNYHRYAHDECNKDSQFISPTGRIKKGTTCVEITSKQGNSKYHYVSYYCRACIDLIYKDMKTILNPQLWVFQ